MNGSIDKNENSLFESLKKLADSEMYPLHMPGHKRNPDAGDMSEYMDIDITEIDDYDNLHDAEGIIKEAENRANELYGAGETHFLVNGSTCGVLTAVSCVVPKGGRIIAARNVHKSFYHAVYLRELEVTFVLPTGFLCGEEDPKEDIEKAFNENPDAKAVFITSPTYEGFVADVQAIADMAHRHGAVLIVDEAHGAHFGLYKGLPQSAIQSGADIVIHSVHKTLGAMTQTALIHVKGDRIDREKLRRFLRIYQSSSPSYVLMASIDSCIKDISNRREEIFEKLLKYRKKLDTETRRLKHLFIMPGSDGEQDPGKVLICAGRGSVTGQQIYDILRLEYKLQCEMAGDTYALAIITGYDTEEGIDRLIDAIKDIDRRIEAGELINNNAGKNSDLIQEASPSNDELNGVIRKSVFGGINLLPKTIVSFYKAWDGQTEDVDISRASGRVAGDFINLYPPGIPLVIPGELIDKELVERLGGYINQGRNVQGVRITDSGARMVCCLKGE